MDFHVSARKWRPLKFSELIGQEHIVRTLSNAIELERVSHAFLFSGTRGGYTEDDLPDATDVYGIAKLLGEVRDQHTITLRTSIIGHELQKKQGLIEWFLSQQVQCHCYTQSIFSGFI